MPAETVVIIINPTERIARKATHMTKRIQGEDMVADIVVRA
jgi:hypothetical protein